MTRLVGTMLLLACAGAAWAAGPPDAEAWERFGNLEELFRLAEHGNALSQQGKFTETIKVYAKMLRICENLYSKERFPEGHTNLATCLNNLAELHRLGGDYAKAEPLCRRALEMREQMHPKKRFPQGHPELATSLNNLATVLLAQGDFSKAEALYVRTLEMRERLYPEDLFPRGDPLLASSLNNLALLHQMRGDSAKAELLLRRALEMYQKLYPREDFPEGHPELATCLNNLAELHRSQGDYAKAEQRLLRALEMRERLYPKSLFPRGHPELATCLHNLASLHDTQGDHAKAEPLCRRALEMRERLYSEKLFPHGHPELASSVNGLALILLSRNNDAAAEPLLRRALGMYEKLYPKARYPQGHPELASSLNNLASFYQKLGDYAKAEPLRRRTLEMRERLYPKDLFPRGHPDLADSLNNLAMLYHSQGEFAKAEPLCARGLQMYVDSAASVASSSSEATALNYLGASPVTRDAYLSTTLHLPRSDAYRVVWQNKAALARIAQRRHLAVRAASSGEARELWEAVLALKRQREFLLLAPVDAAKARVRDGRLAEIDEDIRKKETDLRPLLPAMKRSDDLAKAVPGDLRKAMPADSVFIDLLRYARIEQDPGVKGNKGQKYTPHYLAFVVTRAAVERVELGEAKPIEEALDVWRRAVVEASPSESKYAAEVHRLLWSPLVKHLPPKLSAVFVSPDAALNRVPWAALRDGKTKRILLEEYAVAVIPHGPMLLDRFTEGKRETRTGMLLAMGGVAYDRKPKSPTALTLRGPAGDAVTWPALPGSANELRQIVALAGDRKVLHLEGTAAGASALLAGLPRARTAHLATHGFFADAKFRTAFQLDEKLFGRAGGERSTAGARSPMVLSGLVCAGANVEGTPGRGVVTADAVVGLDLRKLDLAVLSACETGLGDVAGGEGVYGLVRAFHVAGTRNVVASLWKVDDEATAALMALFYRSLWGKEKVSPAEALRRAQLAVYREPGRVKEWAAGRGPLPRPVAGGVAKEKGPRAKTSPARAWAAFVLSGPGD